MRDGATLDPTETPTTTPTSEKTPARKPVLAPRSITTTTKSAINTSRTLRPASSIDRFYRRCKRFTYPGCPCSSSSAFLPGETASRQERYEDARLEKPRSRLPCDFVYGRPRYNLSTMNVAEFLPDVRAVLEERNEPSYRIRQVYKALTGSLVRDWREATNLPRGLQAVLSEEAPAVTLTLERVSRATDGTRKYLFHTRDGHAIETVMIPRRPGARHAFPRRSDARWAARSARRGCLGSRGTLRRVRSPSRSSFAPGTSRRRG